MTVAEVLVSQRATLGEGPVWSSEHRSVFWVDILRGELNLTDLDGTTTRLRSAPDEPCGAVALSSDGSPVLAVRSGLTDATGAVIDTFPRPLRGLRMNDGKPDPQGRFVGGTMGYPEVIDDGGALWSFAGRGAQRLLDGVTISNGLDWSDDGATMYYVDTPTRRIDAFDYDLSTGCISDRRTWAVIPETLGDPDGLCLDSEGGVWVAMWGGGSVVRFNEGRVDGRIDVPTPYVTCPTFAGDDLNQVVITTASEPFGSAIPKHAGHLYIAAPGVKGTEPNRLGGWANASR